MQDQVPGSRGADRRSRIAGAAIDLVAAQGVRALTHRAVDRALDLPAGSTSYYVRTRRALLEVTARELAARAREDFAAADVRPPNPGTTVGEIATTVGAYVTEVAVSRRAETVARHALRLELAQDPALASLVVPGPFSAEVAGGLMTSLGAADPAAAGRGFVVLLEGLLLEQVVGSGSPSASLATPIELYLRGVSGRSSRSDGSSATAAAPDGPA